ncbi:MAG: serine/threonine protein kinase [Planctomycetales bacterium]|nr:serine/threonine protein kinase [Planctomycetales bacterium]
MSFLKQLFDNLFGPKDEVEKVDIAKRFELYGRVGQGSMSKVWRAKDSHSGRVVAVKVLDYEKTLRLESRFVGMEKPTEGEIAMTLKHPNIVQTLEHGITTEDEQFLVMEYVEGVSLSFLIDVQNDVMLTKRLQFIIQLGEAIEFFHQQHWIHRDICPRNVLITDEDHQVKLIDFGLVVPNTVTFQAPGNRTGTAIYMAPELIKRQRTDQRIDIFSFAVTCYEMYTRRYPWEGGETLEMVLQHINTPAEDIRKLCPEIDEQVAETIMKGLKAHPDDRWSTMTEMLDPLREAHQRLGIPKLPTKTTASETKKAAAPKVAQKPKPVEIKPDEWMFRPAEKKPEAE